MVAEDEGDEGTSGSSSGDRQGGDRQSGMGVEGHRTEIDRVVNRKEIVGRLVDSGYAVGGKQEF
jgi:hypothetical protein